MQIKEYPVTPMLLSIFIFVSPASAQLTAIETNHAGIMPLAAAWPAAKSHPIANLEPDNTVPITDTNVLNGLTLDNWVCKPDSISSTVCGASLTIGFSNTKQVTLLLDNAHLASFVPSRCPIIAWSVNHGGFQSRQLRATEKSLVLVSGVTNPVIELYIKGMSPFEDRFRGDVPPNSVKLTGFVLDAGGATRPVPQPGKVWMNIGDSIMSGDAALYAAHQGRPPDDNWAAADDGRASYGHFLAQRYGYREIRLAYGGYDWAGVANLPELATVIDQKTSAISRLIKGLLNPLPDVVLINLGENGAPAVASVDHALAKIRSRVGLAAKIIVMIPVSGKARSEITQAFGSYKNATHDSRAYLVDLGPLKFDTADGTHPTAGGHQAIYHASCPVIDAIMAE
ncbi:MAG: hypothetical protein P4N60_19690 [Verrucomicrobiae bacterium]|nr:hypothetical protein [Verrucomicrobiae bacterium]